MWLYWLWGRNVYRRVWRVFYLLQWDCSWSVSLGSLLPQLGGKVRLALPWPPGVTWNFNCSIFNYSTLNTWNFNHLGKNIPFTKVVQISRGFLKPYKTLRNPQNNHGGFCHFYKTLRLVCQTQEISYLRTSPLNHRVFRHCESMTYVCKGGGSLIVIPIVVIPKTLVDIKTIPPPSAGSLRLQRLIHYDRAYKSLGFIQSVVILARCLLIWQVWGLWILVLESKWGRFPKIGHF